MTHPYKWTVCYDTSIQVDSMLWHIHTSGQYAMTHPYKWTVCYDTSIQVDSMLWHVHTSGQYAMTHPYKWTVCYDTSIQVDSMLWHIHTSGQYAMTHPYKWTVCYDTSIQVDSMLWHVHTSGQYAMTHPYKWTVCYDTSIQVDSMLWHIHTSGQYAMTRPYKWTVCYDTSIQVDSMLWHIHTSGQYAMTHPYKWTVCKLRVEKSIHNNFLLWKGSILHCLDSALSLLPAFRRWLFSGFNYLNLCRHRHTHHAEADADADADAGTGTQTQAHRHRHTDKHTYAWDLAESNRWHNLLRHKCYVDCTVNTQDDYININNNVMQNGISKIVKSWRFNQFLLKSRRFQPHYIDAGDIIYVDILPYNLAQKNCCYRPEMSIHQSSDLVGSRILWSGWGYLEGGLIRI